MIQTTEYLQLIEEQTAEEQAQLATRLAAYRSQSLPSLKGTASWDEAQSRTFDEGLVLISACRQARRFVRSADSFRIGMRYLNLEDFIGKMLGQLTSHATLQVTSGRQQHASVQAPMTPLPSSVRADMPRHWSEYRELIPEPLRSEGDGIKERYDQYAAEARAVERLYMDDGSEKGDRAYHAGQLCRTEDYLRNFWARVDAAYAVATGATVSDEYLRNLESRASAVSPRERERTPAEMTYEEIMHMEEGEKRDQAMSARIERDKTYLRKTDRADSEQHRTRMLEAAAELHMWGIQLTATQSDNCKRYGVDIDPSWVEETAEERRRRQAEARNTKRREERKSQA